ncbi:MerR family transcriptional regulator [Flavisolibacter tropicus]|uniref:HTH merR-type domain-containing protein n=1 Tax=Flavisolibacter tropicus TaxID=1492898 RepID=A0A172TUD7_9BACT|nr:MerR family transcriptional regulator [Flavisolibacter tropicus]ANE50650.1 hypothetical protein SY85_09180 [Flavisolibacter tropicus]
MNIQTIQLDKLTGKSFEELYSNHLIDLLEMQRNLRVSQFAIKDTDIEHRTILHWEQEGLIEKREAKEGTWRKFSFEEYVWLRIIKELRVFGTPIPLIKEIKAYLFSSADFTSISTIVNEDLLEHLKASFKDQENIDQDQLAALDIKQLKESLKEKSSITNFFALLVEIIYSRPPAYLLVNAKGEFAPILLNKVKTEEKLHILLEEMQKSSLLSINITQIIEAFFSTTHFSGSVYYNLSPLSRKEKEVLDIIRLQRVHRIEIDIKEEGPYKVEFKRYRPTKGTIDQIEKIIAKGKYGNISLHMAEGNILQFVETEKRIIK